MKLNIKTSNQKLQEKIEKYKEWHPWYAWYPIRLDDHTIAWLETVQRRKAHLRHSNSWITHYKALDQ